MKKYLMAIALLAPTSPAQADIIIEASGSGWCFTYCNNTNPNVIANTYVDAMFRNWFAFRIPNDINIVGATLSIWNESSFNGQPQARYSLASFNRIPEEFSGVSGSLGSTTLGEINAGYVQNGRDFGYVTGHYADINLSNVVQLNNAQGEIFYIKGDSIPDRTGSGHSATLTVTPSRC